MLACSACMETSGHSTPIFLQVGLLKFRGFTEPLRLEVDACHQPLQTGTRDYPSTQTFGSEGKDLMVRRRGILHGNDPISRRRKGTESSGACYAGSLCEVSPLGPRQFETALSLETRF